MENGLDNFGNFMKLLDNANIKCEKFKEGKYKPVDCSKIIRQVKKFSEFLKTDGDNGTTCDVNVSKKFGADIYKMKCYNYKRAGTPHVNVELYGKSAILTRRVSFHGIDIKSTKHRFTVE